MCGGCTDVEWFQGDVLSRAANKTPLGVGHPVAYPSSQWVTPK